MVILRECESCDLKERIFRSEKSEEKKLKKDKKKKD